MRLTTLCIDRWGICAPMEDNLLTEVDQPLVLILLNIFLIQPFLPPYLPPNDQLSWEPDCEELVGVTHGR
ncbi:uncharacterized protein METZ01_LOCUS217672 [marine metagenome]|uniref:Uncharacterized protein n=1 Tax=marine metagenome TaxID=408172 RepID=A0A382FP28_9ZZZZ